MSHNEWNAGLAVQSPVAREPLQVKLVIRQCPWEQVGEREYCECDARQGKPRCDSKAGPLHNLSEIVCCADILKHSPPRDFVLAAPLIFTKADENVVRVKVDEKPGHPQGNTCVRHQGRLDNRCFVEQIAGLHITVIYAEDECKEPDEEGRWLARPNAEWEDEVSVRVVYDKEAHQQQVDATQIVQLVACCEETHPDDGDRQRWNLLCDPGDSVVYEEPPACG